MIIGSTRLTERRQTRPSGLLGSRQARTSRPTGLRPGLQPRPRDLDRSPQRRYECGAGQRVVAGRYAAGFSYSWTNPTPDAVGLSVDTLMGFVGFCSAKTKRRFSTCAGATTTEPGEGGKLLFCACQR